MNTKINSANIDLDKKVSFTNNLILDYESIKIFKNYFPYNNIPDIIKKHSKIQQKDKG